MPLNPASVMTAQPLNIQSPLDAYARVLAAQHAQTQNVLAQQQLAEYQRARGEDEAVRNYFVKAQTAGTPTTSPEFVQGLLGISPARGMSYQQNVAAAQKAATEESARRAKLALDKIAMYRDALVNVRTPEQGYKWVMAQVNDPDMAGTPISKMSVMNVVIPTDPKGFEDWKNMEALGATEFIKLNKPHWLEGGGSQVPVSGLTGRPSETASPIAKTLTPGELATQATAAARLKFEKEKFKYEQDNPGQEIKESDDGLLAINKRTGVASPVRMSDTGKIVASGKALTEGQGNATAYGIRMAEADQILRNMESQGVINTGAIRAGVGGTLGAVPLIGESLGRGVDNVFNVLPSIMGGLSEAQQKTLQARVNFITAVLRKESGASIAPSEFATAEKNYFPAPGDSINVVKQKQASRQTAIKAMKIQAGRGAAEIEKYGGNRDDNWEIVK